MVELLIVEDQADLNRMLCDYFSQKGFTTIAATDGPTAIGAFFRHDPALVILDRMLPEMDGIQVARAIRASSRVPIIMLTALGEEEDRLEGFDVGVDDYVVKPFSIRELESRVRAVLRRSPETADSSGEPGAPRRIAHGELVLDLQARRCLRGGQEVELTGAQFEIVRLMLEHPGRVFTRLQLLESFQPDAFAGYERTIDVHIKNIRKALEPDRAHPTIIETVRGVGYRIRNVQ